MAIPEIWPRGLTRQAGLIGMPEPRGEVAPQEEQENTEGAGGGAPGPGCHESSMQCRNIVRF